MVTAKKQKKTNPVIKKIMYKLVKRVKLLSFFVFHLVHELKLILQ